MPHIHICTEFGSQTQVTIKLRDTDSAQILLLLV